MIEDACYGPGGVTESISLRKSALKARIEQQRELIEAFDRAQLKQQQQEAAAAAAAATALAAMQSQSNSVHSTPRSSGFFGASAAALLSSSSSSTASLNRQSATAGAGAGFNSLDYSDMRLSLSSSTPALHHQQQQQQQQQQQHQQQQQQQQDPAQWYAEQTELLEQLKAELQLLREQGDEFNLIMHRVPHILRITAQGRLVIYRDQDSESEVRFIDELIRVRPLDNLRSLPETSMGRFALEWAPSTAPSSLVGGGNSAGASGGSNASSSGSSSGNTSSAWSTMQFSISTPDEFFELIGCHLKRYNTRKVKQIRRLQELFSQSQLEVDRTYPQIEVLLERLWTAIFPHDPSTSRAPHQWKLLGFQNNNPATDFRSMGLLGLQCLTYFAETFPVVFRNLVAADREYPIAAACINIAALICQELHLSDKLMQEPVSSPKWHSPLLTLICYLDHEFAFHEIFCAVFELFDRVFVSCNAGYMNFQDVRHRVKTIMLQCLDMRPLSMLELRLLIDRLYPRPWR
ncbi:hypothetical protein CAOG_06064 [Capsaspora owczarzaki ATCC 30864]|uniref:ELMO domain-containing protein n=1 Tax=Capsaspora owczarzaki (strain ATCC 30864) TaxID=595528 RepID=A0A0D2WUJ9_CAPO3|nr:hypothetical protein CAOG_06064 [Capsaspora owczarzaki ATCC 30864]KJE95633.1 hypothetical protein CAOG_006064 [Capsaspora owczarzaki ATCC 30864]|eukprot:XP_004345654.1 hypothetical protein CAOG_06064 [Capsaspora owczarzaki ATCC 30864]